jgi:5,5'-dehydrodivanillate O-demethylase
MNTNDHHDFVHVGPEHLAGRYLRRFWQPVYLSKSLEKRGTMRIRVLGEDYTLYRGDSGKPQIVDLRCAHRRTQLTTGWVEGDSIRCMYHGWKYESSGQCVEQPAENPPFCQKVRIGSYPTEEYLGLIFGYFGPGEPPPFPRWPEFERPGTVGASVLQFDCSFFQFCENVVDDVHLPFVHRLDPYLGGSTLAQIPEISAEETQFGMTQFGTRPGDSVPRPVHFMMPNRAFLRAPPLTPAFKGPLELLLWFVPIDDEHHNLIRIAYISDTGPAADEEMEQKMRDYFPSVREEAAAVLGGKKTMQDLAKRRDLLHIQDHVILAGQGAIVDRSKERLGRSDGPLIMMRKIWSRELRALADDKPLTPFTRPEVGFFDRKPK